MRPGMLMALAVAMSSMGSNTGGGNDGSYGHGIPDKPKKVIPKGCKVFNIRGIEVVALTYDRAWKKAEKILKNQKGGSNGVG